MKTLSLAAAAGLWAATPGAGAGPVTPARGFPALTNAAARVIADLERASVELDQWRAAVAGERLPLAERRQQLESEVARLREQVERLRRRREQGRREQEATAAQVEALEKDCRFVFTLLSEYRRSLETRIGRAESALLSGRLEDADRALRQEDEFGALAETAGLLADLSAERCRVRLGGMTFAGTALDAEGVERQGRFAVIGPLTYFVAAAEPLAGLGVTRPGGVLPAVAGDFDAAAVSRIETLARGAAAVVPVDVTGGDALRVAAARESLVEHLRKGGFVMIPLLAVGAAALVLTLAKVLDICRARVRADRAVADAVERLARGDVEGATAIAARVGEPLSSLLLEGIRHRHAAREHIEEILHEHVAARVPRLERYLGILAVLGAVSPLLGLLGTVTGMIHTFELVTVFGTGNARLLSSGISEALVTTEFGLAVAIPVLLAHAFLARRVRGLIGTLETSAEGFVNAMTGPEPAV